MSATLVALFSCGRENRPQCAKYGVRERMDCDAPYSYDAQKIKGGIDAWVAHAQLNSEKQALRTISEKLQQYSVKRRDLCLAWNACAIRDDEYSTELRRAQTVLDGLSEYKTLVDAGQPSDGRKAADSLARVQDALGLSAVGIEFSMRVRYPKSGSVDPANPCPKARSVDELESRTEASVLVAAGDDIPTGAQAFYQVRALERPAYLYLFQRSAKAGSLRVLFPRAELSHIPQPLPTDVVFDIPRREQGLFCLDNEDLGEERVYVVASATPLSDLEQALPALVAGSVAEVAAVQQLNAIPIDNAANCPSKTRAFELQTVSSTSPRPGCVRSRGWTLTALDSDPQARASFAAKSEAGDSLVVKVFPFRHVAVEDWSGLPRGPRTRGIMLEQ